MDASAIHPESYAIAEAVLEHTDLSFESTSEEIEATLSVYKTPSSLGVLAQSLKTGIPTLEDIIDQLIQPGRDPRTELPAPILRSDVLRMEDLVKGMLLKGTVRNVVDFGDLSQVINEWLATGGDLTTDLDCSGVVDFLDYVVLAGD